MAGAKRQNKKPFSGKKNKKSENAVSGTREWWDESANCCRGCSNDCRYCYARWDATKRWGQIAAGEWSKVEIRQKDVLKRYKKYGTVMFPTTHDILPENLYACIIVIENLLRAGNHVLIVSKPWYECIDSICRYFKKYKKRILFRFTIGSTDDDILRFWEPNAPTYQERKKCLKSAFKRHFQTSVSCEPMLDSKNIDRLIKDLLPFITHSFWIGKMNKPKSRVGNDNETKAAVKTIKDGQTDDMITSIYERHKDNPKIRWKESIKEVVGIELLTKADFG
jgi:DNA repair photolyase